MENIAAVLMMMTAPLVTSVVILANAKRINADWRERRARRLQRAAGHAG